MNLLRRILGLEDEDEKIPTDELREAVELHKEATKALERIAEKGERQSAALAAAAEALTAAVRRGKHDNRA